MTTEAPLAPHPDRLLPADPETRVIARELYHSVKNLPIISPHGHTDPSWFAGNQPFPDPATLFIIPDHYIFRMLYSQGVPLEELGVPRIDGGWTETDTRKIWRRFAAAAYDGLLLLGLWLVALMLDTIVRDATGVAAFACELGAPVMDLNFGCPAKTVNRSRGGAVLLKEPLLLNAEYPGWLQKSETCCCVMVSVTSGNCTSKQRPT